MVCIYVLHIPMDIGFGVWALTAYLGPIPMALAALYYGFNIRRGYHGYQ